MYYTVIKHDGHLRTWGKYREHKLQASVFYISRVFSNVRSVLSQCNSRIRLLHLLYDIEVMNMFYLRNKKPVPRFYRVIETQVEVWENEKCCGNKSCRWVFPQLFRVLPNFHECFYNSIVTSRTWFLFLLENTTTKKGKQLVYFDYQNLNSLCSRHHHANNLC